MSERIKPEEVFNRVNEAILMSKDNDDRPIDFAKAKVIYYDDVIHAGKKHNFDVSGDEHLRDIWEAVVQHFANQNKDA